MGDKFSFNFKLHEHTADPIKVSNLVSSVLATLDNEIKLLGETSNGDVLQGLAMALAIRSKINTWGRRYHSKVGKVFG